MKCLGNYILIIALFLSQFLAAANTKDSLFSAGEAALETKEFKASSRLFSQFLKQNPDHQGAQYNLALSYYKQDHSVACLENILEIKHWKSQEKSLSLAVWCAHQAGHIDSALYWMDLLSDGEKNAELLLFKGKLMLEENPEKSKLLLSQALTNDPGMLEVLYYRAKAALALKDTAAALSDLNVLLTHRKNPDAYALRAKIRQNRGRIKDAFLDYQAAFDIEKDVKWKYAQLSLLSEGGNYEQAYLLAEEILEKYPQESEKIAPIRQKLLYIHWVNAYWIYVVLGVILILITVVYLVRK